MLVSHVVPAGAFSPLDSFRNAVRRNQERIVYWSDSTSGITLAGAGEAYSIKVEHNGPDRFAEVEEKWRAIAANSMQSFQPEIPQTGLLLMGGGVFDPLKARSERWEHFANAEFHVPQILLTQTEGKSWLTLNYLLQGKEDFREITQYLMAACEWFLAEPGKPRPIAKNSFSVEAENPDRWLQLVDEVAQRIREGEWKKVVLARELRLHSENSIAVAEVLQRLHEDQPESHIFAFVHQGDCLLGASPECLVRREEDCFYSTCLAGSIRRGKDQPEDQMLGEELLQDPKNQQEHRLVVQMISDKLKKYCEALEIPAAPFLVKLKNIQHLCTPLVGKARPGTSLFHVAADLHPTPALGGFPQQAAMKKIREEEPFDRGWYGGPLGWADARGNGKFIVAIRCGLIRGKEISLFAGCGIVGDSEPLSEYEETMLKLQPMLAALGGN
ncbi:isochorismate synthase [Lucifera butyrica]|uniref:isochorismate synthase n=1 Tax=Lucifera butyrica TaxID=1351585 RepID=A0A498R5L1_9FIRM|nr:isochorismate synthase [Lucifera butyrica]